MSHWSLEKDDGSVETLTLAQLEERVRNGDVSADARVSRGGSWIRVAEIPYLRRHLRRNPTSLRPTALSPTPPRPTSAPSTTRHQTAIASPVPSTSTASEAVITPALDETSAATLLVRRDSQGKPLPLEPKHVELLLSSTSERPRAERLKKAARWLWLVAVIILVIEAIAFANLLLRTSGR